MEKISSRYPRWITGSEADLARATRDPGRYPTNTLILPVAVTVVENDPVILSEAKVNPPGLEDARQPLRTLAQAGIVNALDALVQPFGRAGFQPVTTPVAVMAFDFAAQVFQLLCRE